VIALEKKETFSEKLIGKFKESLRKTRIGFESEDIRVAELRRLRRKTGFKFVAEDGLVEKLRLIKDEFEIESLRKAGQITRKTWQELKKSLRVGMTEREGMKLILDLLHKFGADGVPNGFFPIVASGPNSAIPHHNSGSRKIGTNEVVLIDFGCIVNGYCSDMTRVMMIGNRSKEYERIEALVKRAYGVAVDLVKEGTDTRLIDEMVGEILGSAGYSEKMPHSTGHGVGLDIHENPAVSSKSRRPWRLASGMVITIEPGIYLPGKFGIRYENTLLVTKDGYEILTD
jgi:Xaa-Pro aminopeptidase